MQADTRHVALTAGALVASLLLAGCGAETEIVIRFPSPGRCVAFGEDMPAESLEARLAKEQDASAIFDAMDFRLVVAPGMSEEDERAAEEVVRRAIRSLGARSRIVVVRERHLVVRILTSVWFWAAVVLVAVAGYAAAKVKKAKA